MQGQKLSLSLDTWSDKRQSKEKELKYIVYQISKVSKINMDNDDNDDDDGMQSNQDWVLVTIWIDFLQDEWCT